MDLVATILRRLYLHFRWYVWRDPSTVALQRWFRDNGDHTLRLDYPLSPNSVVFDVGGYQGDWSAEVARRFDPTIYVFEPVPAFYEALTRRFSGHPKVAIFNLGLYGETKTDSISLAADSSSIYGGSADRIPIRLVDVQEFLATNEIAAIDLIKVNIEGAEYSLLRRMIDCDIVSRCADIQIQFHSFYPGARKLRAEIRRDLSRTHFLTFDYPFVWENWRRKDRARTES